MNSLKSAKALFLQGKLDQAEFLFLKNLEIEEEAETFLFLGMIQVQKKDYESAYHFLIKCIEKNPDDGNACNELGVVCLREGKEKEAVYWLKRAVLSLKNDARHVSLYNLAILYKIWNRPERSLQYIHRALTLEPDFRDALLLREELLSI
ncbi:MAG: hypothetical protein H7A25_23145 [Leptospiraceae bacterium]|nr:hypothetical protein [Leptospiraceae bacterium]MCP5502815.1 hypothetical protein [Leptospiraceae bacterium]